MIMNRVWAECCGDYFIAVSLGGVINLIRSTFFPLASNTGGHHNYKQEVMKSLVGKQSMNTMNCDSEKKNRGDIVLKMLLVHK